jgi:hypothetical protein
VFDREKAGQKEPYGNGADDGGADDVGADELGADDGIKLK